MDLLHTENVAVPLLTLLVAIAGYRLMRQRWAHDHAAAQREERRWQRAAAERVWVSVHEHDWPCADEGTYRARVATVRNDSDGPARDVILWWFLDGQALPLQEVHRRPALAPGQVWAVAEPTWLTHMPPPHQVTARLWFADLREQEWETSGRGQVRPLREAIQEGYDFLDGSSQPARSGPFLSPR